MSPSAGTRLGRYEIRSKIGKGGMGEVYRAFDPKINREVAIKILPPARNSAVTKTTVLVNWTADSRAKPREHASPLRMGR